MRESVWLASESRLLRDDNRWVGVSAYTVQDVDFRQCPVWIDDGSEDGEEDGDG